MTTFEEEMKRFLQTYFNFVEPACIGTVTKVGSTTADVRIMQDTESLILRNTPVLKPCYGTGTINISIGDKVMLIFSDGNVNSAYITGKL